MKDIAPELLEKIKKDFNKKFDSSKKIKSLYRKVKEGKASYEDALKFAQETGRVLSQAFKNNLSSDELPDGKLYYNIANRVVRKMLEKDFDIVANLSVEVQNSINKKASINIKGIKPKINKEKVDGIIDLVSGKDVFDDISYMLDEPIVNYSQSVVDDTVKTNAEFQYESGLNPRIRRISKSNCCEWCNKLAGEYNYVETKGTDVYRRHTNCNCLVEFIPGNGKKQNVHTKKWSRTKEKNNITNFETVDAKRLPNAKERSRIIREAINAPLPIYAEELRKVYKFIKPKEGYMDVVLHGAQYYTEYEHTYKLDTETLSLIISGRKDYKPEKNDIRLLSCSTGKVDRYGNCVAQELANLLGVNVYAPIEKLYIYPNGELFVGKNKLNEKNGFKLFYPKKEVK